MATPNLTPVSTTSAVVLPSTGSHAQASDPSYYAFGMYVSGSSVHNPLFDFNFISGAIDQVSYTYKKLGGDVLDIELTTGLSLIHI